MKLFMKQKQTYRHGKQACRYQRGKGQRGVNQEVGIIICAVLSCVSSPRPHGLYTPPGCSVHGVSQERILEWVAIALSRGSSPTRDRTRISCVSCMGRQVVCH